MKKIIISADSTCDLSPEFISEHEIAIIPLHIILDGKEYKDMVDINPEFILDYYDKHDMLPTTAAPNIGDYIQHFSKYDKEEYEILHFSIGSALSSSFQNSQLAASEFDNVTCIDSKNLSTGIGMLILQAVRLRDQGQNLNHIHQNILDMIDKVKVSFVVNSLEFLKEGGRVSALAALGASVLSIKPSIKVYTEEDGKLDVGKKYRGNLKKTLSSFVADQMKDNENIDNKTLFITHSIIDNDYIRLVLEEVNKYQKFDNIYITDAGSTVTAHCGKSTVGLIYKEK